MPFYVCDTQQFPVKRHTLNTSIRKYGDEWHWILKRAAQKLRLRSQMSVNDYIILSDAFRSTKGYAVYMHIQSISISFGIFLGNEQELMRKLWEHADFSSLRKFDGMGNQAQLDVEFREIIRLVHNYATSVMSLVDHTRRIARKLLRDKHLDVYQGQVDLNFTKDSLTGFIQDLRNYLLHFTHPPISRVIRCELKHIRSIGIELATNDLLKWDGWSKRSMDFLKCHEEGIELASVVTEYGEKVHAFWRWLDEHIRVACKRDLDELWAKHDEWAGFCKEHGIPTTDEEFRRSLESEQ